MPVPLRPAGRTIKPTDSPTDSDESSSLPRRRPSYLLPASFAKKCLEVFKSSLNFYRIHLLCFTFIPLVFSGIFYASNGEFHIDYIDCLFNCVSAFCVCGLATINLSTCTGWQQAILFILMVCGSPVSVSIIMILVRRHFFRLKFKHVIESQQKRQRDAEEAQGRARRPSFFSVSGVRPSNLLNLSNTPTATSDTSSSYITRLRSRLPNVFGGTPRIMTREAKAEVRAQELERRKQVKASREREKMERLLREKEERKLKGERKEKERLAGGPGRGLLSTDMIKRVEGDAYLINPAGQRGGVAIERLPSPHRRPSSEHEGTQSGRTPIDGSRAHPHMGERTSSPVDTGDLKIPDGTNHSVETVDSKPSIEEPSPQQLRRSSEPDRHQHADNFARSKTIAFDPDQSMPNHHHHPMSEKPQSKHFPRTGTIEFVGNTAHRRRNGANESNGIGFERTMTHMTQRSNAGTLRPVGSGGAYPRSSTARTGLRETKKSGFGGFPMPHEIIRLALAYFFPKVEEKLQRTMTLQPTATFASARSGTGTVGGGGQPVPVPYITFDAIVGRNSQFKDLTSDQLEELGGVEYRALKVLTWIVPVYFIGIQLSMFIVFWPYIGAKGRYDAVFEAQPRLVPIGWFSAFQSVSAFSNTGMSLVDLSMLPFQDAYVMIFGLIFLILAGNTAYPIFLRFFIWCLACVCPQTSRLHETCRFLLDHPRRCYTYLFPSRQTMFLLIVIIVMSVTDWVSFLVLDIGTPAIEAIPVGTRIAAGMLQSAAVRAAGFAIVPMGALAPAVKVLYTIMMYISVYPIAMSVRATNVYEERSLGVFNDDDDEEEEDVEGQPGGKVVGWSRYIAFHARRQLAFDIWWLGLALWLVCIIERGQLNNVANESYFNIFSIIFELVSAYGTVGLSLGLAYDNYSLSGGFSVLSKLVVCIVMIRGRHRGLPVAIDRAVMLPNEFEEQDVEVLEEERMRRSRRESINSFAGSEFPHTATTTGSHRRASSFSNGGGRVRPPVPQPFFPTAAHVTGGHAPTLDDESALADDEPELPPVVPPQTASSKWADAGLTSSNIGGLTPVREMSSAVMTPIPTRPVSPAPLERLKIEDEADRVINHTM